MRVLSIQAGRARTFPEGGRGGKAWRSAIDKRPVEGAVQLGALGLEGDTQVDRRFHGGPDRALLAFAAEHYPRWSRELGRELPSGSFGENLTLEGLDEREACIGDTLALGEAVVQVSQPRVPCVKLARFLGAPDAVERAFAQATTGFYLRVLREGIVRPGELRLVERAFPALTVERALAAMDRPESDVAALRALADCPVLSLDYRAALQRRLDRIAGK